MSQSILIKSRTLADGTTASFHQITEFLVDQNTFDVTVKVGAWAEEALVYSTSPLAIFEYQITSLTGWDETTADLLPDLLEALPQWIADVSTYTIEQRMDKANKPSFAFTWDELTRSWDDTRTLEEAKIEAWEKVKARRNELRWGGFTHNGMTFDSRTSSVVDISAAVQMATLAKMAAQPFLITFTLADNTRVNLSADQMISVGLALGAHVQTLFGLANAKRDLINAKTTNAEADAVTWES